MKRQVLILLLSFIVSGIAMAQLQTTVNANNNNLNALATYGPDGANIGATSLVINPPKPIEGSLHLFDTWKNNGVLITKEDKQLLIRNINFNVDLGRFESRVSKDTIFSFSFDNIERVYVNSREFKAVFKPITGLYSVYEVIYQGNDFALLKQYRIDVREGSDNPMVNRPSKYVKMSDYMLQRGDDLTSFKFRKRNILQLAGDKSGEMQVYARKNNMSFKNELDVNRMLSFFLD